MSPVPVAGTQTAVAAAGRAPSPTPGCRPRWLLSTATPSLENCPRPHRSHLVPEGPPRSVTSWREALAGRPCLGPAPALAQQSPADSGAPVGPGLTCSVQLFPRRCFPHAPPPENPKNPPTHHRALHTKRHPLLCGIGCSLEAIQFKLK